MKKMVLKLNPFEIVGLIYDRAAWPLHTGCGFPRIKYKRFDHFVEFIRPICFHTARVVTLFCNISLSLKGCCNPNRELVGKGWVQFLCLSLSDNWLAKRLGVVRCVRLTLALWMLLLNETLSWRSAFYPEGKVDNGVYALHLSQDCK